MNVMHTNKLPIIIVGGGIGGLTAALALSKQNISSILLEQAPQFRETGAGIQLCPNVFKMFDYLNITAPMTEIAVFPDNLIYVDGITGERFLTVSLGAELISHFHYPYGVFHREELLRALVKECKKSHLVQLVTDTRVIQVEQDEHKVYAKTEKGETYEGEALIGCDGIWSVVRNYVLGPEKVRVSGHVSYRGVVPLDCLDKRLCPNDVVHWVRDNCHLVHYPIGSKGLFNIIAIFQTENDYPADDTVGNPEELKERFKGSQPEILQLLEKINMERKWMLCDRDPVSNWSRGRITLLGDSAHPTLPYLTQGAGMAIEDSVVLAKKIVDFDRNYEAAFDAYQKERYLRAGYVQLFSRAYGETHHSSGVARELRNFLISKRTAEENYEWLGKIYKGIEVPA
jgi:salicylate hydroxylase